MQPAQLLVQIDKAGRHARKRPFALIGGEGRLDRLGRRLEKGHEALFHRPLLGQRVKPLLGLGDLVLGVAVDLDPPRPVGNVAPQRHQLPPHGKVINHLRIIARREGGDRRSGKTGEVGRAAKLLQPLILFQIGLQRDRRGERVLLDPRHRDLEDAGMDRLEEMLGLHQRRDAVVDVVIRQNGAEQLLFGLDIMRKRVVLRRVRDRAERRYIVHHCPPF